MFRRKAYDRLAEWKDGKHTCLLIKGQRGVGKTSLVQNFAELNYNSILRIDFEKEPGYRSMFDDGLDVDSLVGKFSVYTGRTDIEPGKTLIFLDEIQVCPGAMASIERLSDDGRFDVIAASSLPGPGESRISAKVKGATPLPQTFSGEQITMHSLDFEEFLWAFGVKDEMINKIRSCIRDREPLGDSLLEGLNRRFRDWMITGGMPEAVGAFIDRGSWMHSNRILRKNTDRCLRDIRNHVKPREREKTLECFRSIPDQLGDTNKRFMFSRLEDGGSRPTREKYAKNLSWIEHAGYTNICRNVSQPSKPLEQQTIRDSFKIYMSDTGSLAYMMGKGTQASIYDMDFSYNNGAVIENAVAECLMKNGIEPRYFNKPNGPAKMEIDFVFMLGGELIAVEVKSGKSRNAPSISKLPRFYDVDRRVMFGDGDIHVDGDGVEHYPFFVAAFVESLSGPSAHACSVRPPNL